VDDKSLRLDEQRNSAGSIIAEPAFEERLRELRISHRALDEILEVYPLALRSPDLYPEVPASNIRRVRIEAGVNHPALRIWIEYDGEVVKLIDTERADRDGR
jgi:hypothetical protein